MSFRGIKRKIEQTNWNQTTFTMCAISILCPGHVAIGKVSSVFLLAPDM
jgi:hypothetical protein